MPEIKNTFLKSRMNKDTEARILPQGEYRDAQNASVSASEDASVGSLENIRGNKLLTSFGLTDFNIEIIGQYADTVNNRIYFFLTNYTDASVDSLGNLSKPSATAGGSSIYTNFVRNGANNYIAYCQLPNVADSSAIDQSNVSFDILVSGTFLNFSKTHPISGVNMIENLLFWTDNRNQPRKINVDNAILNPLTYYANEDNISVAKYAPYEPISFLKNTTGVFESTLLNKSEEWQPAFWGAPGQIFDTNPLSPIDHCLIFNENSASIPNNTAYSNIVNYLGTGPFGQTTNPSLPASNLVIRVQSAQDPNGSYALLRAINTGASLARVFLNDVKGNQITNFETQLGWSTNNVFLFSLRNPQYDGAFAGDKQQLEDKFVRFSYRFKYDDNEYSLSAPFSQHAFVPKQYGYFIEGDDENTKASSIVEFMENQITTAGLVINLPYKNNELSEKLKVNEIQLLYKASDDLNVKVIADVKSNEFNQGVITAVSLDAAGSSYTPGTYTNRPLPYKGVANTNNLGSEVKATVVVDGAGRVTSVVITASGENYSIGDELTYNDGLGNGCVIKVSSLGTIYIYNYNSEKPIKVLTDEEVTRVSDIVPMRAQTQEVVGNRIVYGNFLQNNTTPLSLDYSLKTNIKGSNTNTPNTNKEFLNHTLKQNRSYQVGIVLQDRYGRASNVIINQEDDSTKNSSIFTPYSNGGTNPLDWPGDSLNVVFNSLIPSELPASQPYNGLWEDKTNPLGWYTYKIVVQQQEQDYYNIYTPGALSGNIIYTKNNAQSNPGQSDNVKGLLYSNTSSVTSIALFNDNINKIPRDLKEVGPTDNIYGSSVVLYNRVKQIQFETIGDPKLAQTIGQQNLQPLKQEVNTVRPFSELGKWTAQKNIDLHYLNSSSSSVFNTNSSAIDTDFQSQYLKGTFIYPGAEGEVDPFFLRNNKNPLIATISTKKRMGFTAENQQGDIFKFADKLMVFETAPFQSKIDIYYETSSTGIISELNSSITVGDDDRDTDAPFTLSPVVAVGWNEKTALSQPISNIFEVLNSLGTSQAGVTALSTNVTIHEISSGGVVITPTAATPNPIIIQQATAPVAPNKGPTFRLVLNKRFVYTQNSDTQQRYDITLEISTSGFPSVFVTIDSIGMSNIAPSIERISNEYKKILPSDPDESNVWLKSQDLSLLFNADKDNPIDTVVTGNVGVGYSQEVNAIFTSFPELLLSVGDLNNVTGLRDIARFSHVTNGFDPVVIFNATTDSENISPKTNRLKELSYSIFKVERYVGEFKHIDNPDTDTGRLRAGRYYLKKDNNNNFEKINVTSQFDIIPTNIANPSVNPLPISQIVRMSDQMVTSSALLPPVLNPIVFSRYRKCFVFVLEFKITDAGGGTGFQTSGLYNINFIVTKF